MEDPFLPLIARSPNVTTDRGESESFAWNTTLQSSHLRTLPRRTLKDPIDTHTLHIDTVSETTSNTSVKLKTQVESRRRWTQIKNTSIMYSSRSLTFVIRTVCARQSCPSRPVTRVVPIEDGPLTHRLPKACISRVQDKKWPAQVSTTSDTVENSKVGAAKLTLTRTTSNHTHLL